MKQKLRQGTIASSTHQPTFGKGRNKVVIEEFLNGIELSVFVLTDGNTIGLLPETKDYKKN